MITALKTLSGNTLEKYKKETVNATFKVLETSLYKLVVVPLEVEPAAYSWWVKEQMEETSSTSLVVVGEEPWGVLEEAFMVTRVPTVEDVVEADMVLMVMEQKEWWRVAFNLLVLAEKAQKIAIVLTNGPAETTIESLGVSLRTICEAQLYAVPLPPWHRPVAPQYVRPHFMRCRSLLQITLL